jgi:CRISPR/Cas system-associated endoribonuclease Cas2
MKVDEAYAFYETEVYGLSARFVNRIYDSFVELSLNPFSSLAIKKTFRQFVLKEFLYVIIYKIHNQTIELLSVFYTKRNPHVKFLNQ